METINVSQLGRAGVSIAEKIGYKRGYTKGVEDTLQRVNDWLDEETLDYVKELLLDEKYLEEKCNEED